MDATDNEEVPSRKSSASCASVVTTRTQLTFDFHRLNVLLLRAIVKDTGVVGRKIATATMTEAKVYANIGENFVSTSISLSMPVIWVRI